MLTHIKLLIPPGKQKNVILSGNTSERLEHSTEEEENGHQICPCWKECGRGKTI